MKLLLFYILNILTVFGQLSTPSSTPSPSAKIFSASRINFIVPFRGVTYEALNRIEVLALIRKAFACGIGVNAGHVYVTSIKDTFTPTSAATYSDIDAPNCFISIATECTSPYPLNIISTSLRRAEQVEASEERNLQLIKTIDVGISILVPFPDSLTALNQVSNIRNVWSAYKAYVDTVYNVLLTRMNFIATGGVDYPQGPDTETYNLLQLLSLVVLKASVRNVDPAAPINDALIASAFNNVLYNATTGSFVGDVAAAITLHVGAITAQSYIIPSQPPVSPTSAPSFTRTPSVTPTYNVEKAGGNAPLWIIGAVGGSIVGILLFSFIACFLLRWRNTHGSVAKEVSEQRSRVQNVNFLRNPVLAKLNTNTGGATDYNNTNTGPIIVTAKRF